MRIMGTLRQRQLARTLRRLREEAGLTQEEAGTGTLDVVDASVALCARERDHHVVTSDPQDFAVHDPQLPVVVV